MLRWILLPIKITFSNALIDAAQSDYKAVNILRTNGYYSHSIYHFQQSFEKAIKALYCHFKTKYEKNAEKTICDVIEGYGHNTKKSSLDLLIMISKKNNRLVIC